VIAFHLPITPPKATSQGAGKRMVIQDGKPMFFKNGRAQSAEHDILILCKEHRPPAPLSGAIKLQVDFVFPWREAEAQWRRKLGRVPHTARPDCDNLVKQIADALTKLRFYGDDGQVADLHVTKAWGKNVGIYVSLSSIEPQRIATIRPDLPRPPRRRKGPSQDSLFPPPSA